MLFMNDLALKLEKITQLFSQHTLNNFNFNEEKLSIVMVRNGNCKDDVIFHELQTITQFLMENDLEFSIDEVGTILIS